MPPGHSYGTYSSAAFWDIARIHPVRRFPPSHATRRLRRMPVAPLLFAINCSTMIAGFGPNRRREIMRLRLSVYVAAALWIQGLWPTGPSPRNRPSTAAGDPPVLPGTQRIDLDGRHRFAPGRRRRSLPARRDREIGRTAGPLLEPRQVVRRRLQRLDRAEPQAIGAYPGDPRRPRAVRFARTGRQRDRRAGRRWAGATDTGSSRSAGPWSATCMARACC